MCTSLNSVNYEREIRAADQLIGTDDPVKVALGETMKQGVAHTRALRELYDKIDSLERSIKDQNSRIARIGYGIIGAAGGGGGAYGIVELVRYLISIN